MHGGRRRAGPRYRRRATKSSPHGLGNSADYARGQLQPRRGAPPGRSSRRSRSLRRARARAHDGPRSHDIDSHWDAVRVEFRTILTRLALERALAEDRRRRLSGSRIEFQPRGSSGRTASRTSSTATGTTPICATDYVMAPLSPLDPRRIARGFSGCVPPLRRRRGERMKTLVDVGSGSFDCIAFAAGLGARGLFRNLAVAVYGERGDRAVPGSGAGTSPRQGEKLAGRARAARRCLLAKARRISLDRLRALLACSRFRPSTHSVSGILAGVLLDRLGRRHGRSSAWRSSCVADRELESRPPVVGRGDASSSPGAWRTVPLEPARRSSPTRSCSRTRAAPGEALSGRVRGDGAHPCLAGGST